MTAEEFQDTVDKVAKELGGRISAKKAGLPEAVATTLVSKLPFRLKNQVKKDVIETLPSAPSPPGRMGRLHRLEAPGRRARCTQQSPRALSPKPLLGRHDR